MLEMYGILLLCLILTENSHAWSLCIDFYVGGSSNKEKVFDFLHELCTFYENLYMTGSLVDSDGVSIISEKVYELAGENGLPVEEYEAIFTSFSLDKDQEKRDKVSIQFLRVLQ